MSWPIGNLQHGSKVRNYAHQLRGHPPSTHRVTLRFERTVSKARTQYLNGKVTARFLQGSKALLGNLAHQIKLIDTNKDHAPVAREVAAMVIVELCDRYKITITQR